MNKTETELRELIDQMCKERGREGAAVKLGVTPQYISMLLSQERNISAAIADRLGYERQAATTVLFIPKNNSQSGLTSETKAVTV